MKTSNEMNTMTIEALEAYQMEVEDMMMEVYDNGTEEEIEAITAHNEEITAIIESKFHA